MLQRADLWSLEQYSEARTGFRDEVLAHKANRRVQLGRHVLLLFEDRMTIKYQIQEMLRIEKIFESEAIQEELDAYNPLIPDGDNWKATMLIQYEDVDERKQRLVELQGIEDAVWVEIGDTGRVFPVADEDMDRSNETKTSAVHFLRFQLDVTQAEAARTGAAIRFGVDHAAYACDDVLVDDAVRQSLASDLGG